MPQPLQLGSVPYLNAQPLVEGLDCEEGVSLVEDLPCQLARRLRAGELDAALVSSLELFRDPALAWVEGPAITSSGPVWSIRLYRKDPAGPIRTVALDRSSLSAAALTRICVEDFLGARDVQYIPCDPECPLEIIEADAVLRIGDPALVTDAGSRSVLDLGALWTEHTGLPFVYALWLVRPGVAAEPLVSLLAAAARRGIARRDDLARTFAQRWDLPAERCVTYLRDRIGFSFGAAEREGLCLFGRRCAERALVERAALPEPLQAVARSA